VTFNDRTYWSLVVFVAGAIALAIAYHGGSDHDAPRVSSRPAEKAVPVDAVIGPATGAAKDAVIGPATGADPPKVESFAAPAAPIPGAATAPAPKPGRSTAVPMPAPMTVPPP
jgi:hypothetical protein